VKRVTIVFGVWMLAVLGVAAARAQGTGRSLDIQPGARQNGMGAAGVALIGDACDAAWWNPAALGFAGTFSAQRTHARLLPGLADLPYDHYSAAVGFRARAGVAVSGTNLSYGSDSEYEKSVALSVGAQPLPGFALGATVKHIRIHFGPGLGGEGETNGYDFGALDRIRLSPRSSLSFGVNLQNLIGKVSFMNEDAVSPLSHNLKVGAALDVRLPIPSDQVTMGTLLIADYNQSLVDGSYDFHAWNGGLETCVGISETARVALRAGSRWMSDGFRRPETADSTT